MKLLSSLLIVFLTVSFLLGCEQSNGTANTATIQDLTQYRVGNQWTYNVKTYDTDGSIREDTTYTATIDSAIIYNGIPALATSLNEMHGIVYYVGTDELHGANEDDGESTLAMKYPMGLDETIVLSDTTYPFFGRIKRIFQMISANTTVSVPAGTYQTVHYRTTELSGAALDTTSTTDAYFAFGIGLVQQHDYIHNEGIPKRLFMSFDMLSFKK